MIPVVVSSVAHCGLLTVYGNSVSFGQIQEADEIWIDATTKEIKSDVDLPQRKIKPNKNEKQSGM